MRESDYCIAYLSFHRACVNCAFSVETIANSDFLILNNYQIDIFRSFRRFVMSINDQRTNTERYTTIRIFSNWFRYIIGLILLFLISASYFDKNWGFKAHARNLFSVNRVVSNFSPIPTAPLLSLYEEELSRVEKALFRPQFHNHQLTFKLNLTTMAANLSKDFTNSSERNTDSLQIIALRSFKDISDFQPICEINLTFSVELFNTTEKRLTLLQNNASCLLSLTSTSNIISIAIQQRFSADDRFSFTHQWLSMNASNLFFWSDWPVKRKCLDNYLGNLRRNENAFSNVTFNSPLCPSVSVLTHSTSRELFREEQSAMSDWLDLQSQESIHGKLLNRSDQSKGIRRLAPFEIAEDPTVCSKEFQEWIQNYQRWHENITFLLNNGSMTLNEQRNRIIELDVRFVIYENPKSGIADRVIHLITTYLVALLTRRLWVFCIDWPEFLEVMQFSMNSEQQLAMPWFAQLNLLNENISSNDQNYLTFKPYRFSLETHMTDYDYEKAFPERIVSLIGHIGRVIHTIQSNSSIYKKFLADDLKLNANQIFGCLTHSLFTYKLNQLIRRIPSTSVSSELGHSPQQILQTLLSPKFSPIGIQIRAGDETIVGRNSNPAIVLSNYDVVINKFISFFVCAQDITKTNQPMLNKTGKKSVGFLLADSVHIRQAVLRRWKFPSQCLPLSKDQCQWTNETLYFLASSDRVLHLQHADDSMLAFQLGIFDMFLFSLCEQHIITTDSGFGRFPAFISLKQRNLYTFALAEKHSCLNQGVSLAESGYHWSKI